MLYRGNETGITALGMVTAVGYDAETACASAHAGLSRLSEIESISTAGLAEFGDGPAFGHAAKLVGHGHTGYAKVFLLAQKAISEILSKRRLTEQQRLRTGFAVVVSERYFENVNARELLAAEDELKARFQNDREFEPEPDDPAERIPPLDVWRGRCQSLAADILEALIPEIPKEMRHVSYGGHAAVVQVLDWAVKSITEGRIDRAIVGGVDSQLEPGALLASATCGVLNTEVNPSGYYPGEAAAFLLIEKSENGHIAIVRATASTQDAERMSDEPPSGTGIASCISSVLAQSEVAAGSVRHVFSDLNGDHHRAKDWGNALVRLQSSFNLDQWVTYYPAVSFGETGAASGFLATAFVARGFQRGYLPRTAPVLVCQSSESGARGSLLLESAV